MRGVARYVCGWWIMNGMWEYSFVTVRIMNGSDNKLKFAKDQADNNTDDGARGCDNAIRPEDGTRDEAFKGITRGCLGNLQ